MKIHSLKLSFKYYEESEKGIKNFEIRKNDRDFKVGDILELREWIHGCDGGKYTGNCHYKIITYILEDEEYLKEGYVCLGLAPIAEPIETETVQMNFTQNGNNNKVIGNLGTMNIKF